MTISGDPNQRSHSTQRRDLIGYMSSCALMIAVLVVMSVAKPILISASKQAVASSLSVKKIGLRSSPPRRED